MRGASRWLEAFEAGTIVTVHGEWVHDQDFGYNTFFWVTSINRNGKFPSGPSYSTQDADSTTTDDCDGGGSPSNPPTGTGGVEPPR